MNDDYTPEQWAQIQANAKAALRRNPRNAAARSALKDANAFLASQREATNVQERADANPPATTPSRAMAIPDPGLRAGIFGAAQGASSGFADEIVGAMQAIRDPTIPLTRQAIDSSIADVRSQMNDVRSANPGSAIAGNVAGAVVNPDRKSVV